MLLLVLQLLVLAGLFLICGRNLSRYGDLIATYSGLGKAWIGIILLATVTSLPELAAGISSVQLVRSADLAVGNVVGSCVFNLFTLSLLDLFNQRKPLFSLASDSHILAASMGIILMALVGLGLFLPKDIVLSNWVGLMSLVFLVVYFLSVRVIFLNEQHRSAKQAADAGRTAPPVAMRQLVLMYLLNALIVVIAAIMLPGIAAALANKLHLSQSIAGTLFLAAATTLPEATVSITAVRMGAYDLAVGNLVGSNLFNVIILSIDEFFYTDGYLLKDASDNHVISVFAVIIMTAIAIAGLSFRPQHKSWPMAWDSLLIALVYVANLILLYLLQ